jgi:hypothetical protein
MSYSQLLTQKTKKKVKNWTVCKDNKARKNGLEKDPQKPFFASWKEANASSSEQLSLQQPEVRHHVHHLCAET